MGKSEREDVFFAEQIINSLLNREEINSKLKQHKLFHCSNALANRIRADFPSMKESHHIGNVYGTSLGNIKLVLSNEEEIYLELKFLVGGLGTRANIGQDSLTDFRLFKGENICSWSRFRENKNHRGWVEEELNKFDNYPQIVKNLAGMSAIYEKAAYLKNGILGITKQNTMTVVDQILSYPASPQEKLKAARIIKNIMEKDRTEKIEYIEYLRTLNQNHENIKKFLFLILAGAHTYESLEALWNVALSEIIQTLRHKYYVYYVYKGTLETEVEDYSEKLRNLLDRDIFMSFRPKQTNVMLSFNDVNGNEISILRIVFHWKNKFQGIQTPCLNIFDDRYLRQDLISSQSGTGS